MEINWLIIILSFAAILAIITFLVRENQKDEKTLMKKSMKENEISKGKEPDTEIGTED
jgi:preprotein translocase subunit YajC